MRIFVLFCVFLGGLGQGVVNPKLPELLSHDARLALDSGISASLMYIGIFAASFLYGRIADRGRVFHLLAAGLILYSLTLVLFCLASTRESVFALRLFEGLALSAVYVSADVVLCRVSRDEERGRWLSYYGIALSLGLLAGPALILCTEKIRKGSALVPVLTGLALLVILTAIASFFHQLAPAPQDQEEKGGIHTQAGVAAMIYGFLEAGLVAVLAALTVARFQADGEMVFVILILAAAPASLIWGLSIDRIGGKKTLLRVFFLFAICQLVLLFLRDKAPGFQMAYFTAAAFGVAAGGIYPAGFAWLVDGCSPRKLGYASAYFTRAYGLGSLLGPVCFGIAVEKAGEVGFFSLSLLLGLIGLIWAGRSLNARGVC